MARKRALWKFRGWIWAEPCPSGNRPIRQSSNLPMGRVRALRFPVQVFEGRLGHAALDRPVGGVALQLHRAVVDGDEEGKRARWAGAPGPRMGRPLPESRPQPPLAPPRRPGAQVPSAALPMELNGRAPVGAHDHQAVVGRGRKAHAAAADPARASGRPGRPGRAGDTGARDRTRTGAGRTSGSRCSPPVMVPEGASVSTTRQPAAIRSSWSPARPEPA